MNRARRAMLAIGAAATAALVGAVLFACSQTPTSVPVRTFERAQRLDTICLRVLGVPVPEPRPVSECAPVPEGVDGSLLEKQLFALVTQSTRGEIAVVDLSAGGMVDQSRGTPGINFLPVGSLPTDVAASADGEMAFVAAAEPNKFAIYGIPGRRVLGDSATGYPFDMPPDTEGPTTLTSWPVCSLPQRPGALTVVERRQAAGAADGGAADFYKYELVAILPGDRSSSAKLVTIDPRPFLRGSAKLNPDGTRDFKDFGPGPELAPGALTPCVFTSAVELVGEAAVPNTFSPGPRWDDGVKWVDGGVDIDCDQPQKAGRCGLPQCKCTADAAVPEGGPVACEDDAGATPDVPLTLGPIDPPKLVAVARDDTTLYIADEGSPLIHVVDLSTPGTSRERPPLLATSVVDPSRTVAIRDLAVSPATREFKRFLYAVDKTEGSVLVYDVTDPATMSRTPMRRPHPELNPFQPPDRLSFASPVVAVAFARHDFPLSQVSDRLNNPVTLPASKTGLLCNPNNNLVNKGLETEDFGFFYRANRTDVQLGIDPRRLRGVFAFATLANGQIVTIDVDDWDAPCRRPSSLTSAAQSSALATPQPDPDGGTDFDPYHAPTAATDSVTNEIFVPISSPHRMRSAFLLRDDSLTGRHVPYSPASPVGQTKIGSLALVGQGSERTPRILPATGPGAAPSTEVGVTFSNEVPDVHFDQDWAVTYEGALPGFDGLAGTLSTTDDYQSLVLSQAQGRFCSKGVEDWSMGEARASAVTGALAPSGRKAPDDPFEKRMIDYVQISDDLLDESDPYWSLPDDPGSCWDGVPPGRARAQMCSNTFGAAIDEKPERDFPILEAFEDRLVLGRFFSFQVPVAGQPGVTRTATREAIYKTPANASVMKRMRCCFHHQAKFRVRAGSQWVAVGTLVGFLNHVVRGEGGRCVASCDPREVLLNGRAPSLPNGDGATTVPGRDSPLAMRNPMFSFYVQNGTDIESQNQDFIPSRDSVWRFQTRGQFIPVSINLAASTTSVNPQSMRFIESLDQIAVVDGSSQGLVLIDLSTVAVSTRGPYF